MIKIENIEVHGFGTALRGMRNSYDSWENSDTIWEDEIPTIGNNDLALAQRLIRAGASHRTFMRMIQVYMDINAPLYWWKEMDRYCVGKTQISCSTMHSIHKKPFELDDFSHEHLIPEAFPVTDEYVETYTDVFIDTIKALNGARYRYLETKDKKYWWQMIQLLPTSYNQKRTIMMSYEVALKIIRERRGHRLDEWQDLIVILLDLPYMKDLVAAMDGGGKYIEAGN